MDFFLYSICATSYRDQGNHWGNNKREKTLYLQSTWVFLFQKYGKLWSKSKVHLIKHEYLFFWWVIYKTQQDLSYFNSKIYILIHRFTKFAYMWNILKVFLSLNLEGRVRTFIYIFGKVVRLHKYISWFKLFLFYISGVSKMGGSQILFFGVVSFF